MAKVVEPKKHIRMSFKRARLNVPIHFGNKDFVRLSPCGAHGENDVTSDDLDYVTCGDCIDAMNGASE